jgi:HEAT repeat protein
MRCSCAWALALGVALLTFSPGPREVRAFEWAGRLRVLAAGLEDPKESVRLDAVRALAEFPLVDSRTFLLKATADLNDGVRLAAARALARHREHALVPILVEWLSDIELNMRVEAVNLLGEIGDNVAVGPLIRAFGDVEHRVREAVVEALGKIGSIKAVTGILARLDDSSVKVRLAAIRILAELTDARSVIPLLGRLNDPAPEVREAAVTTLTRLGDARAVPAIIRLLRDPAEPVRMAAILALTKLASEAAVPALRGTFETSRSQNERMAVLKALGRVADASADALIVGALRDPSLRDAAREALSAAGARVVPRLAGTLRSGLVSAEVGEAIVQALRDIGDRRASRALVEEFERRRVSRRSLVEALATCGDADALAPLLRVATGEDKALQLLALGALERIVDRRAITPLLPVLRSADASSRQIVVRIMGKLRANEAIPDLLGLLRDESESLRLDVVQALGRMTRGDVAKHLLPLVYGTSSAVRRAAGNALAGLRARELVPALVTRVQDAAGDPEHRATALDVLGATLRGSRRDDQTALLLRLAGGKDAQLACAALGALAAIQAPGAGRSLPALARSAPDRIRAQAVETLGYFPSDEAVAVLTRLLTDKEAPVRAAAAWALGRMATRAPVPALQKALDDLSLSVRINAAGALARLARADVPAAVLQTLEKGGNAFLQANLVLALGRSRDVRHLPVVERVLRGEVVNPYLYAALIRSLTLLGAPRARLLAAAEARGDEHLARLVQRLLGPEKPGQTIKRSWIGLTLVDATGAARPAAALLVVLPDGLVRTVVTDERAQFFEEDVPEGQWSFESASTLAD